jgi:excinuclease ABC subunit C
MIATVLEGVDGLGVKRRERLLLEMGSLDNVRQATMEELVALPWLPERVAKNIYDHLRAPTAPQLRRERDID